MKSKNRRNQIQTASARHAVAGRLKKRQRRGPRTAQENSVVSASGVWVRYMSKTHSGYRTLISPRQLQAFGPPRDPWGDKMVPAEGTAPRKIESADRPIARQ